MATASFDEKVVVTDPEMVAKMKADLDDPTPVIHERKYTSEPITMEMMEENAKKWLKANGILQ